MATGAGQTVEHPVNSQRKRRGFQYSLRTLLVLMLGSGCGFGWLAYRTKIVRKQREAVKAIEKLRGGVDWEPASGGMTRTVVACVGKLLGEDLSVDVCATYFSGIPVTDAGLEHLRGG